jgi:Spy/CpxP family protein refolding chaperone
MLKPNLLTATAMALTLSFGVVASIAVAQEPDKQTGKPETGMMGGQTGMMGNRGGGMMGMMNGLDPTQMKRMVENCNRVMESMMQNMPPTPGPGPEKKG